uniref:Putative secreted protein n=1 Tax=Anopheles darlingi TaxID=43151 RepID=A0A2M4D4V3_ANODA
MSRRAGLHRRSFIVLCSFLVVLFLLFLAMKWSVVRLDQTRKEGRKQASKAVTTAERRQITPLRRLLLVLLVAIDARKSRDRKRTKHRHDVLVLFVDNPEPPAPSFPHSMVGAGAVVDKSCISRPSRETRLGIHKSCARSC